METLSTILQSRGRSHMKRQSNGLYIQNEEATRWSCPCAEGTSSWFSYIEILALIWCCFGMVIIASLCSRVQTHGGSQFSLGSISNHLLSSRYFILSKSPSVLYYYVVHLPFFFSFCLILASHYLLYASIFTYYIMSCCKFNYRYINRLCMIFIIHRFDSNSILSCTVTYGFGSLSKRGLEI